MAAVNRVALGLHTADPDQILILEHPVIKDQSVRAGKIIFSSISRLLDAIAKRSVAIVPIFDGFLRPSCW